MSSNTGKALNRIVRRVPPERITVITERPGAYGPLKRRLPATLLVPLKYRWLAIKYRKKVGSLLPLGLSGVRAFTRLGWAHTQTSPMMYCPPSADFPAQVLDRVHSPVRFLYVGRLSRYTKGTDVLLRAIHKLRGDWTLSIVGGHGDLVDRVGEVAATNSHVRHLGSADPKSVKRIIADHDVVVVPSRFDGWNVVVNEALSIGRGVIVTDQAVSDELIKCSGAGTVVRASSTRSLASAMQRVVDRPDIAIEWSKNAVRYSPLISPAVVGNYLKQQLLSARGRIPGPSDGPPWLIGQEFLDEGDRGTC